MQSQCSMHRLKIMYPFTSYVYTSNQIMTKIARAPLRTHGFLIETELARQQWEQWRTSWLILYGMTELSRQTYVKNYWRVHSSQHHKRIASACRTGIFFSRCFAVGFFMTLARRRTTGMATTMDCKDWNEKTLSQRVWDIACKLSISNTETGSPRWKK